jgi:hypothetical protein
VVGRVITPSGDVVQPGSVHLAASQWSVDMSGADAGRVPRGRFDFIQKITKAHQSFASVKPKSIHDPCNCSKLIYVAREKLLTGLILDYLK